MLRVSKSNRFLGILIYLSAFFSRKRVQEYEQIVITPTCPNVDVTSTQLNDENEDFSSRRRYHQSSIVQGRYVDDV